MNIKENNITVAEYNILYEKVGWGTREESEVAEALKNTIYSVSIYDASNIIGFGRIIGDKTIFLYIQDVMVDPKYQNRGVGTLVMQNLLKKINEYQSKYTDIRVYLGASKGKEGFYERFGFIKRSVANLGEGMILEGYEE